ncbi:MAG: carboxypeptidase regulatory-like domain-containing protein [Chitinispirillaceae bacterium]|nr:carboxypeptidase regulatory-like domain-containing protein [Chitinispirillaceae bacterium]
MITGRVHDLGGKPIAGAHISLSSRSDSAVTDAAGSFAIDLSANKRFTGNRADSTTIVDTLLAAGDGYILTTRLLFNYSASVDMALWENTYRLIDDEIPGWADNPARFASFDTVLLYTLINGGATPYLEHGAIDGIFQVLEKESESTCEIFIYRCMGATDAASLFRYKTGTFTSPITLLWQDTLVIVGSEFLGGAVFITHCENFIFEISLSGYDELLKLQEDAIIFLSRYLRL